MFEMILASFQVENKLSRAWFFHETFLLANINAELVLRRSFLTLSNTNRLFLERVLIWRFYTTVKALPTTKQVKLINKKEFIKAALNKNSETYVIHVVILETLLSGLLIYSDRKAQIASLLTKEVKISAKYFDFSDFFSEEKASVLLKQTKLNQYPIKLQQA